MLGRLGCCVSRNSSCQSFGFYVLTPFIASWKLYSSTLRQSLRLNSTGTAKKAITQPEDRDDDDDPAVMLRRLQEECQEKLKKKGRPVPPAPQRRSGKTQFFDERKMTKGKDQEEAMAASENAQGILGEQRELPAPQDNNSHRHILNSREAGKQEPVTAAKNLFTKKLHQMEEDSKSSLFPTYDASAEARRQKVEQKIKEERKRMLVFRDVGMDLDRPILSRDVFLVFKYFRYGTEFAIDNELERLLRFFNEHALNELKNIQDSKLMRGPSTLSHKQRRVPQRSVFFSHGGNNVGHKSNTGRSSLPAPLVHDAQRIPSPVRTHTHIEECSANHDATTEKEAPFQLHSTFPSIQCANMRQFCEDFDSNTQQTLISTMRPNPSQSFWGRFFLTSKPQPDAATHSHVVRKFNEKDVSLFSTLSPASFRRPALVLYSQLGQKFGSHADAEWRSLAYRIICPALVPHIHRRKRDADTATEALQATIAPPLSNGKRHFFPTASQSMPIDVLSLRSMDLYKYKWVHNLYVRRFAKSLMERNQHEDTSETPFYVERQSSVRKEISNEVNNALVACTTFVGTRLLEPFYGTLGLRNFMSPYAMLVDHEGVIRWLSAGCPDTYEADHFAALLQQLENEYYMSKNTH